MLLSYCNWAASLDERRILDTINPKILLILILHFIGRLQGARRREFGARKVQEQGAIIKLRRTKNLDPINPKILLILILHFIGRLQVQGEGSSVQGRCRSKEQGYGRCYYQA